MKVGNQGIRGSLAIVTKNPSLSLLSLKIGLADSFMLSQLFFDIVFILTAACLYQGHGLR